MRRRCGIAAEQPFIDAAQSQARRRWRWRGWRRRGLDRERSASVGREVMTIGDCALHCYRAWIKASGIHGHVSAVSANIIALMGNRDLDALRAAGIAVDGDRAVLSQ